VTSRLLPGARKRLPQARSYFSRAPRCLAILTSLTPITIVEGEAICEVAGRPLQVERVRHRICSEGEPHGF